MRRVPHASSCADVIVSMCSVAKVAKSMNTPMLPEYVTHLARQEQGWASIASTGMTSPPSCRTTSGLGSLKDGWMQCQWSGCEFRWSSGEEPARSRRRRGATSRCA